MKKNFVAKILILLILSNIIIMPIGNSKSLAANTYQDQNTIDDILDYSGKIMKYNVITNETTEVDMDELRQKLKDDMGNSNSYSIDSYTPPTKLETSRLTVPSLLRSPASLYANGYTLVSDTSSSPYAQTCKTVSKNYNLSLERHGTAAIIGPKITITAAHNIWDQEDNNYKLADWVVYAGRNGQNFWGSRCGWINVYYIADWMTNHNANYDWAICEMGENIGNQVGWLRNNLLFNKRGYN